MMSFPFGKEAPDYWEKGFSVIPTEKDNTKQPARGLKNWPGYCDNLPKTDTRIYWRQIYSPNGLGLCLGTEIVPNFRLGAVDVDDDSLVHVVKLILGACPCAKRGKTGITYFVLVPKNSKIKSCKITNYAKRAGLKNLNRAISGVSA